MKSVLQAGWLLTVAIGNFIVLIVAELAEFPEQVKEQQQPGLQTKKQNKNTTYLPTWRK